MMGAVAAVCLSAESMSFHFFKKVISIPIVGLKFTSLDFKKRMVY